jgi:hypothetical protein
MMMKWEPLFAHLLKLFMRTDKLKKEDSEKATSVTGDGQKNEPAKDSGGLNINMTNNNRSS